MRIIGIFLAAILFCTPALAQDIADADYTGYYFGTQAVFTTTAKLDAGRSGYWGQLLPQEFMYSQGALVEIINDNRTDLGITQLLDVANYPITIGMETAMDNGTWEYTLEFRGCTPNEVKLVLDSVGVGPDLAGAELHFEPIRIGYYSVYVSGLVEMDLELPGSTFHYHPDMPVSGLIDEINGMLAQKYGNNFKADIYFSYGQYLEDPPSTSISVSIYLDGAEQEFLSTPYDI